MSYQEEGESSGWTAVAILCGALLALVVVVGVLFVGGFFLFAMQKPSAPVSRPALAAATSPVQLESEPTAEVAPESEAAPVEDGPGEPEGDTGR